MKVCVLGLGEIGLPVAKYVKRKGLQVSGYDIKQEAVGKANENGIKASTNWQEIPVSDVYIVCVYAGLREENPDFSSIYDVSEKILQKECIDFVKDLSGLNREYCDAGPLQKTLRRNLQKALQVSSRTPSIFCRRLH